MSQPTTSIPIISLPDVVRDQFHNLLELEGLSDKYDWSNPEHVTKAYTYARERLISILMEKGCPVPSHSPNSRALRAAVSECSWANTFAQLVNFQTLVETRNCRGDTALHMAFIAGDMYQLQSPAVEILMERLLPTATENYKNCDGLTLFHIACAKSSAVIVHQFIDKFADDIDGQTYAYLPSTYAGFTPLHFSTQHRKYETVALLLHNDANIYVQDRNGCTPFHLAMNLGDTVMIDLILDYEHTYDNTVNNSGLSHFMIACASSKTHVLERFLHKAETVKFISRLALINDHVTDKKHEFFGYTPLHFAARAGNLQSVQYLMENKASYFALTKDNLTAFQIARNMGFDHICQYLHTFSEQINDDVLVNWMGSLAVK